MKQNLKRQSLNSLPLIGHHHLRFESCICGIDRTCRHSVLLRVFLNGFKREIVLEWFFIDYSHFDGSPFLWQSLQSLFKFFISVVLQVFLIPKWFLIFSNFLFTFFIFYIVRFYHFQSLKCLFIPLTDPFYILLRH